MIVLPTPDQLASLVSNITEKMLGISFSPALSAPSAPLTWCTVLLPIPGKHPLTVGLSSDRQGCTRLSSAMFQVSLDDVDASMMRDSLCELANMTAGLLKNTLALDQALGLPRVVAEGAQAGLAQTWDPHQTVLRAKEVGLLLWIIQGIA